MNTAAKRFSFYAVVLLCVFSALAFACGKRGAPKPRVTKDLFAFSESSVAVSGTCLAVQGRVNGTISNVEQITIELAPIRGPEDCPGCPFNPAEAGDYTVTSANLDPDTGSFYFSYCPVIQAPSHRWRLVGRNLYPGLPFALTNPRVVVMTP